MDNRLEMAGRIVEKLGKLNEVQMAQVFGFVYGLTAYREKEEGEKNDKKSTR